MIHASFNYAWAATVTHDRGQEFYHGTFYYNVSIDPLILEATAKNVALCKAAADKLVHPEATKITVTPLPDTRIR